MKSDNKVIKIIFNLKGRTNNVVKYINLLCKNYNKNIVFDLLIINEKNVQPIQEQFVNLKIINLESNSKIEGMNTIFKEIYNAQNVIQNYEYCCFVEDDNFIFPLTLFHAKLFLDKNNSFIACSGNKFIFLRQNDKNFSYLNRYVGPNTNVSNDIGTRFKIYNGALCYYSLFRKNYFLKILNYITEINDDNMSELMFNFLTIKFGKIYQLKSIYLAREYPRPEIYNVPHRTKWILNNELFKDLHLVMKSIDNSYSDEMLDNSIYRYLSKRFKINQKANVLSKIIYFSKKYFFYILNYNVINNFVKNLGKL